MHKHTFRVLAVAGIVAVVGAACSSDDGEQSSAASERTEQTTTTASDAGSETIVDIAASNPDFSTLVSAVQQAGLAETLSGKGPFTVFAPTNDAFAKIPADQLQAILDDPGQLEAILTYHVLGSKVTSGDLQPEQQVPTVQGDNVDIKVTDAAATINGCNIITTDIEASNGVIHVIDCVITPPA